MRLLYVGESWLGSCARSLKEALFRHRVAALFASTSDHFNTRHRTMWPGG